MNEAKHTKATPGPWKYHLGRGIDPRFHIQTVGGYQIAETPKNGIACGIKEVNEANARLIAAAPEMLEALKELSAQTERIRKLRSGTACSINDPHLCAALVTAETLLAKLQS